MATSRNPRGSMRAKIIGLCIIALAFLACVGGYVWGKLINPIWIAVVLQLILSFYVMPNLNRLYEDTFYEEESSNRFLDYIPFVNEICRLERWAKIGTLVSFSIALFILILPKVPALLNLFGENFILIAEYTLPKYFYMAVLLGYIIMGISQARMATELKLVAKDICENEFFEKSTAGTWVKIFEALPYLYIIAVAIPCLRVIPLGMVLSETKEVIDFYDEEEYYE